MPSIRENSSDSCLSAVLLISGAHSQWRSHLQCRRGCQLEADWLLVLALQSGWHPLIVNGGDRYLPTIESCCGCGAGIHRRRRISDLGISQQHHSLPRFSATCRLHFVRGRRSSGCSRLEVSHEPDRSRQNDLFAAGRRRSRLFGFRNHLDQGICRAHLGRQSAGLPRHPRA